MSLNLELKHKNETCKNWRKGTEAQGEQYNQELQQQFENIKESHVMMCLGEFYVVCHIL